ncbi:MAG: hypothetical protein IIX01_05485, partial [Clostridia bacterium]|nr:hypothetical protein [Clostridia bacterium]
ANALVSVAKAKAEGVKCKVVYTADEKIKVLSGKNVVGLEKDVDGKFKPQLVATSVLKTMTDKTVFAFTNYGNCHKFEIYSPDYDCRLTDAGVSLKDVSPDAEDGEKIVSMFAVGEKFPMGHLLFFTKKGMIKKSEWAEYDGQRKNAFVATKLGEDDEVIAVEEDTGEEDTIIFVTENGVCLNANKNDIPTQGRIASGVRGMMLREGDSVIFTSQINGEGEIIIATSEGKFKKVISSQIDVTGRYKKGSTVVGMPEGEKVICVGYVTKPYAVAIVDKNNAVTEISSEDIPIAMQSAKARKLPGIDEEKVQNVYTLFYKDKE